MLSGLGIDELVSDGGGIEDVDDEGGVLGDDEVDGADDELPGVDGLIVEEPEDCEGDGVTTGGGAFGAGLVEVSRLQPATPSVSPAQSKAIHAFLIAISTVWKRDVPRNV